MPLMFASPPTGNTAIPADVYRAEIAEVRVEDQEPDQFHDLPYRQFVVTFALLDLPGQTIRSWINVPAAFVEKSNATKLLKAATLPLPHGAYDPADWVGAELRLNVIERTRMDGTLGNKVEGFLPAARREPPSPVTADQRSSVPF